MPRANRTSNKTTSEETPNKRAPIEVGDVEIGVSDDTSISILRKSKLDSDPVALAVHTATPGVVYDIKTQPGKEKDVLKILRRAGNRYNKGLKTKVSEQLVKFSVGEKRLRKDKTATPSDEN